MIKPVALFSALLIASGVAFAQAPPSPVELKAPVLKPEIQQLLPPVVLAPQIHGPSVFGVSPGHPFLYRIPATGQGTLTFSADKLPDGLTLDAKTGIISGAIAKAGTYPTRLGATGPKGKAVRPFTIECSAGKFALTPPMVWNSWSVFGEDVTDVKVLQQAQWLIDSGLAARGWDTIVVDDTWQARRAADGSIQPNKRFGSIAALALALHQRGLKLGLLSSPNPHTPTGHVGSARHEDADAATFARWGVDYLKYDWHPEESDREQATPEVMEAAYKRMGDALKKVNRDIVFEVVTYGFGGPDWNWVKNVNANVWTARPGMLDNWNNLRDNSYPITQFADDVHPGYWYNPGTLMLGRFLPRNPRFTRFSLDEQKTQMTLWGMAPAPLTLSCNLSQLDPNTFYPITTALLTNDELLAINQDTLGKGARQIAITRANGKAENDYQVWTRPLADGTLAVAIVSVYGNTREISLKWSEIGLTGTPRVRDVWMQRDVKVTGDGYSATIPTHGAVLLKVGTPKAS